VSERDGWPRNAVEMARLFIETVVRPGDFVVDATCGNGKDTVYLARLVGEKGRVLAVDIQRQAVERTRSLITEEGVDLRVILAQGDHAQIGEYLREPVKAAMFNLGYLPRGDKNITTRPETTIPSLQQVLKALAPGGLVTVVVYTGHPGGLEESEALLSFARGLPQKEYTVIHCCYVNQVNRPPQLIVVKKNRSETG